VIDIHSHLLPAVDDGSQSIEQSVAVLSRFAEQGIDRVVCTPHLKASYIPNVPHEAYAERFAALVAAAPPRPALARGWEIMLDIPGADLRSPALSLGASTAVLIEFPHTGVPTGATEELYRLRSLGIVPVLAHPERYFGCTVDLVREWRQLGVVMQIDGLALGAGGPMGKLARALLEAGHADLLASDNHGDSRSLAAARAWLEEMGAREQAELLTTVNARRVLAGEPIIPVGPVRLHQGLMRTLRRWFQAPPRSTTRL
jgi:protein-tyrosine phosphatase